MDTRMHGRIKKWLEIVERYGEQILIEDYYDEAEIKALKAALEGLLAELDKK